MNKLGKNKEEKKIKEKDKRFFDHYKRMLAITSVALVAAVVFAVYQLHGMVKYKQQIESQYNRAFFDMVGYVNNVENLIVKSLVTTTQGKTTNLLEETWRNAALAQTNLSQLPIKQEVLTNTSKFLVQVGDYCYYLAAKSALGEELTDDEYNQLKSFQSYAEKLNSTLSTMVDEISVGRLKWGEVAELGNKELSEAKIDVSAFENMQKEFQDYPALIYDGPFSDHIADIEPKAVKGDNINESKGEEIARSFFGKDRVEKIENSGLSKGKIPTYSYSVTLKGGSTANIDITQKGGLVFWMNENRTVGEPKLDIEGAKKSASEFLEGIGLKDMKDSYYMNEGGIATINYVYQKDDVLYYPDMVKVKVALDNGEILGYEAKSYLTSHTERTKPETKISMEDAEAKLKPQFEVQSRGMAVIPTEFRSEVAVYEFKGKINDKNVLVYINCANGNEENVLIILDSDNGILTL